MNRLASVGKQHASVAEGGGKAVLLSRRADEDYRNRLAGSDGLGPAQSESDQRSTVD